MARRHPLEGIKHNSACKFFVESLDHIGLCYWVSTGGMCINKVAKAMECPQAKAAAIMRKEQPWYQRQRGFTLIEVLISIAIMAVLSAVVVPNMKVMLRSANASAANMEMATMTNASLVYRLDTGEWPASSDNLVSAGLFSGVPRARYTFSGANITGVEVFDYGRGPWKLISWQIEIGRWY